MNKTAIEWCDYTWNPVTGCEHGCPYCYARKIAERFRGSKAWPNGFDPTIHNERSADPLKMKKPQTIFVCSMADLFGNWVPDKWIDYVMESCKVAPWHTYIFLTKNPARYLRLPASHFKGNKWFGTTITTQNDYHKIMTIRSLPGWINTFISFEPLLGPIDTELETVSQVIIGAQTNPFKEPYHFWISEIIDTADKSGVKVFCKDSLAGIPEINFRRELCWSLHK